MEQHTFEKLTKNHSASKQIYCEKRVTPLTEISMHSHPDIWEIVLQLTGEYVAIVDNEEFRVLPGDILIFPPYVQHGGSSDTPFTDIFIRISDLHIPDFTKLLMQLI